MSGKSYKKGEQLDKQRNIIICRNIDWWSIQFCGLDLERRALKRSANEETYKGILQLHMFQLSRFERRALALPILPEISRFEMILSWMSDIECLFTNSMWKSWLLLTTLDARVALIHYLHHQLYMRANKSTYCFNISERSVRNEF